MRRINKVFLAGLVLSAMIGSGAVFDTAASDATRTNSGGGVTVKVTPVDLKASGDLRFQVVLDTHSVDLDGYDLKRLVVLRDRAANVYHPTGVDTKGSGHHRTATVSFASPSNGAKNIELVIKGIAGIKERVFPWQLE